MKLSTLVLPALLATPAYAQVAIDTPSPGTAAYAPFTLAGWALDLRSPTTTGVDVVHVWAFPPNGAPAIFLGDAPANQYRPDLAAIYGPRFGPSGYSVYVTAPLPRGLYTVGVYAHSTVTGQFDRAQYVSVDFEYTAFMESFIDSVGVQHYSEFDVLVVLGWGFGCGVTVIPEIEIDGQVVSRAGPSEVYDRPDIWTAFAVLDCPNAGTPVGRYAVRALPRFIEGDHTIRWKLSYGPLPPTYADAVDYSPPVTFHVHPPAPPRPQKETR